MKKVLVLIVMICSILNLVGCSSNNKTNYKSLTSPSSTLTPTKSELDILKEKYNIQYFAKDIEYNMPNMLDTEFVLVGKAKLSDYYNYGFKDKEEDLFCVRVEPLYGTAKETWYVYIDRKEWKSFYNLLVDTNEKIAAFTCTIPSLYYKDGQDQLAYGHTIVWE